MIDIAEFQLIRDCALSRSDNQNVLPIPRPRPATGTKPPMGTHETAQPSVKKNTDAVKALEILLDPDYQPGTGKQPDAAFEAAAQVILTLRDLSVWLSDRGDRANSKDITAYLDSLDLEESFLDNLTTLQFFLSELLLSLVSGNKPDMDFVARVTRIYLVIELLLDMLPNKREFGEAKVWALLNQRTPLVKTHSKLFPRKRIDLVRAATVADLYVIRSEWRGYSKGDIASLRNVMAKETFKQMAKQTTEHETTATTETTETTVNEQYDENRTSGEMSREINTQLNASLQARIQAEYGVKTPVSSFNVSGGADASLSIGVSERYATRTSQEAVKRASSRVESSVRKARSERELTRIEHGSEYGFTNPDNQHVRGVYRWLDRIDRYQLFRIPDRLQLEFQLPVPSEYYRWRTQQQRAATANSAPPAFTITPDDIYATGETKPAGKKSVAELAAMYKAGNLPACPEKEISLVDAISAEAKDVPDNGAIKQKAPIASVTKEIVIPEGYEAKSVLHSASATPARGKWWREKPNVAEVGFNDTHEGVFHAIVLEYFIGDERGFETDRGAAAGSITGLNTSQGKAWDHTTQFGDAFAYWEKSTKTMAPRARVRMSVGFRAIGASHLQASIMVTCQRTEENLQAWRYQVYEALYSAWQRQQQDWEAEQQSSLLLGRAPGADVSGTRGKLIVREEIKRQVIAWLLNASPFQGLNALKPRSSRDPSAPREIDFTLARASARTIQFFEQAFDWENVMAIFYPFFWSDRDDWFDLGSYQGSDAEFEQFMRAGSARVVLPVRKQFDVAVLYWLVYQEPFLGKPLPLPGDPMFVSVAEEIRQRTRAPNDGIAVDKAWDSRTPTTLVWLDDSPSLPRNSDVSLGTGAHAPAMPITLD